jgi:hypothetical protein
MGPGPRPGPELERRTLSMEAFLQQHSGELTILFLGALIFISLLILVPQLLRAQQRSLEWRHAENMRALEQGFPLQHRDDRSIYAGRMSFLVPMVTTCSAATVTCFLAAYRSEIVFSASLAVWSVAGVVSLAAITGGVALMGRLAQLHAGAEDEELPENPTEK